MNVVIDVTAIPREKRDDMARPLLQAAVAYFEQPGVEEAFREWLKEYRKRNAATSVAGT